MRHEICHVRKIELGKNKFSRKEMKYVLDVYIILVVN